MNRNTIRLVLEYPPQYAKKYGMNSLYAGKHWSVRKKDADFWHWTVQAALRRQKVKRKPFSGPVELRFWWSDRLDLSNEAYAAKMIEDALKGWVLVDDSKKYVRAIHHGIHSGKGIMIEIEEMEEE